MLVYDCSWRHAGGDARSLLAYFFAKQHGIMSANRLYADACARLYQSAEFVPDFMADQFAAIMKREPFAFRILTHQLGDLHTMATCPDAAAFLESLFLRFP
jgi:hypothetical protein